MKAKVTQIQIGNIVTNAYQLVDTSIYVLSMKGLADCLNKHPMTISRFLESDNAKALIDKGCFVSHDISVIGTSNALNITAIGLPLCVAFIKGQARVGNEIANNIIDALLEVSLEERIRVAFNELPRTEEQKIVREKEVMDWKTIRAEMKSNQTIFQNGCIARKIPAPRVHDYITKRITGWTATEAKNNGDLIDGERSDIGLNYQENTTLLAWIDRAKQKVITYRKGTWEERCDRAIRETSIV
jgi:hypothetical protein